MIQSGTDYMPQISSISPPPMITASRITAPPKSGRTTSQQGLPHTATYEHEELVNFITKLREIFSAFIGMTLAFTIINFVFLNITGGCLVFFGLLAACWCFVDRNHTTYLLNAVLQLLLCVTVATAVGIYFPGFELYSTNPILRSISIAHVPIAFIFSSLSLYLAWIDWKMNLNSKPIDVSPHINNRHLSSTDGITSRDGDKQLVNSTVPCVNSCHTSGMNGQTYSTRVRTRGRVTDLAADITPYDNNSIAVNNDQ